MSEYRLRFFAGPNGSGKSTLFEAFAKKYRTGSFLNADLIEHELSTRGFIDLNDYELCLDQKDLEAFLLTKRTKSLIEKAESGNYMIDLSIRNNIIVDDKNNTRSYVGSVISAFLRHHLTEKKLSFCFETVMSHASKIEEIKEAKEQGYKTYLYFICTDNPKVNISRVENRVEKGGHNVAPDKISGRYFNLISAVKNTDKCYLFDNSGKEFQLIATKVTKDELSLEVAPELLPDWFINYVLKYYLTSENSL